LLFKPGTDFFNLVFLGFLAWMRTVSILDGVAQLQRHTRAFTLADLPA